MNSKKLERYKKVLLDKRLDLLAEHNRRVGEEAGLDRSDAMDSVDQADSSYNADYNLTLREKIIRQIREVDEALARISQGSYGVCDNCGDEIPEGRLKVRPNARYCAACKEDLERKGEIK